MKSRLYHHNFTSKFTSPFKLRAAELATRVELNFLKFQSFSPLSLCCLRCCFFLVVRSTPCDDHSELTSKFIFSLCSPMFVKMKSHSELSRAHTSLSFTIARARLVDIGSILFQLVMCRVRHTDFGAAHKDGPRAITVLVSLFLKHMLMFISCRSFGVRVRGWMKEWRTEVIRAGMRPLHPPPATFLITLTPSPLSQWLSSPRACC